MFLIELRLNPGGIDLLYKEREHQVFLVYRSSLIKKMSSRPGLPLLRAFCIIYVSMLVFMLNFIS